LANVPRYVIDLMRMEIAAVARRPRYMYFNGRIGASKSQRTMTAIACKGEVHEILFVVNTFNCQRPDIRCRVR
jgi:hypothetical protein